MKIQGKILLIALGPLALLGILVITASSIRIQSVLTDSIQNGLQGAALSVSNTLEYINDDAYYVDEDGNLFKGDFNVSADSKIGDDLRDKTDMDITVFYGDTRYMTSIVDASGNRVVGTQADTQVVKTVLEDEQEYFSSDVNVLGQPYFGYYVPLYDNAGDAVGMVFAGMPQANAIAQIQSIFNLIVNVIVFIGLIAAAFMIVVVRKLVVALRKGTDTLERVSQGKLNVTLDDKLLKRRDEVGQLSRGIIKLRDELAKIIGNVKAGSEALNDASAFLSEQTGETANTLMQIEKAVSEIADGASSQADETQTASNHVINVGNMIGETSEKAEEMSDSAQSIQKLGQESADILHDLAKINQDAKQSIDVIYTQTNTTNQSAQKIKEAIDIITNIAEETNLLSLNASIEAARAGEQGRGFAVVASQIQKLAEQSNTSAQQIEEIVATLIADSNEAVKTMDTVKEIMDRQSENVAQTDKSFGEVLSGIGDSIKGINEITGKLVDMDGARTNVVDAMQNLTAIAEENAAGTEETSASLTEVANAVEGISVKAQELQEIAGRLDEEMSIFVV